MTFVIARQPRACALDGVIEKLQAALPARVPGDADGRFAHPQPVEDKRHDEQHNGDSKRFPHGVVSLLDPSASRDVQLGTATIIATPLAAGQRGPWRRCMRGVILLDYLILRTFCP